MLWIEMVQSPYSVRLGFEVVTDIAGNKSTLTPSELQIKRADKAVTGARVHGTVYLTANGQTKQVLKLDQQEKKYTYIDIGQEYTGYSVTTWKLRTVTPLTLAHPADGGEIDISVLFGLWVWTPEEGQHWNGQQTVAGKVPPVGTPSTIRAEGVDLGTQMEIQLSGEAGFANTIVWKCGSQQGTIAEKTTATTIQWTPTLSLAAQETEKTTVAITLTSVTYHPSGLDIGGNEITVVCTIPASVVPTASVTVSPVPAIGIYVQGQQAKIRTTAAGAYGSSIKNIAVMCGRIGRLQGTGTDVTFFLLDSGTTEIVVTVTDSRGRTATVKKIITVTAYAAPWAEILTLTRCNQDGTENQDGGYVKVTFRAGGTNISGNTIKYSISMRVHGTETWTTAELTAYRGQWSVTSGSCIKAASAAQDWDVVLIAEDAYNRKEGAVARLSVAFALIDLDREGEAVGIGQRATTRKTLHIGLETCLHGHRIADVGTPEQDDDAVTMAVVKALYPVGAVYSSMQNKCAPADVVGGTWSAITNSFGIYMWERVT